jgi:hypothetical protein
MVKTLEAARQGQEACRRRHRIRQRRFNVVGTDRRMSLFGGARQGDEEEGEIEALKSSPRRR